MPALTSIGATIADRRRGLNLTQQTLSDLGGVSRSTVQALEYGSGSIRLKPSQPSPKYSASPHRRLAAGASAMMTAPAELRQMGQADVYINDARAACSARDDRDRVTFRYHTEFLDARIVIQKSATDPWRGRCCLPRHSGRRPPTVVQCLRSSPDSYLRGAARCRHRLDQDVRRRPFDASALRWRRHHRQRPYRTRRHGTDRRQPAVDNPEVADFSRLAVSLGETIDVDPIALSGVQPKVSAQRLTTTVRRNLRPAILKFSPARYPRIAENEDFFLRMARGCGLRTRPTRSSTMSTGQCTAGRPLRPHPGRTPDSSGRRLSGGRRVPGEQVPSQDRTAIKNCPAPARTAEVRQQPQRSNCCRRCRSRGIGNGDLRGKNLSIYAPEDFLAAHTVV